MIKTLLALVVMISVGSVAAAAPSANKLVKPDAVTVKGNHIVVTYTLPCESDDTVTFVLNSDDTGDRAAAVGVVSSRERRNCRPHPGKQFVREIDPTPYSVEDTDAFEPMDVL